MYKLLTLISRFFISLIFIVSGIGKLIGFSSTIAYMQSFNVPNPTPFLVIAVIIEILCGLSILLGIKARYSALILLVFLVIITCVFHLDLDHPGQRVDFLKNLAIMGALLQILLNGSGPWSVCSRDF